MKRGQPQLPAQYDTFPGMAGAVHINLLGTESAGESGQTLCFVFSRITV